MRRTEIHNMAGVRDATRRLAGWVRFAAWCTLLYAIHSPWNELGGIASEMMRWTERVVLPMGFVVGCFAGWAVRAYIAILPTAILTALAMVALRVLGLTDTIGVVFAAFVAYLAGVDTAGGAYPMMMGESGKSSVDEPEPPPWLGV
jgi:hypothetical protein